MTALESLLFAGGRPTWELPELSSLHRLPARATLTRSRAVRKSLAGSWQFRRAPTPSAAISARGRWHDVEVPSLWTALGFDAPHYTNVQMPFPQRPPQVPEENPTGTYRRRFRVPASWRRSRIRLGFDGVEGALYVVLNGEPVGISKDCRTTAEFDITDVVRHDRENELEAVILRWSDASFVEDQDMWWHAGIARDVYVCASAIDDVEVHAEMDGRLTVRGDVDEVRLLDPRGRELLRTALPFDDTIAAPALWSAETPALYTLELTRG